MRHKALYFLCLSLSLIVCLLCLGLLLLKAIGYFIFFEKAMHKFAKIVA